MRKVWIIARHEYLTNLRRPGFIITTLLIPVLGGIGLLMALLFGGQGEALLEAMLVPETVVGYVDHSEMFTPMMPDYEEQFEQFSDEESGQSALLSEEIDTLVVISADYMDSGKITVINREGNTNISALEYMDSFLVNHLLERGDVDPAFARRISRPYQPVMVSLSETGEEQAGGGEGGLLLNMMIPYILGIFLAMSIFTSSGYLLRGVTQEKTSRVMEIILSSVNAWELLAGKIVGLGVLGLTQVGVWLLSSLVLSGGSVGLLGIAIPLLTQPRLFILSVVYYMLGFMVFAVLMGTAGSIGTTEQEANQISGLFSFFATVPMMVIGFMFTNPNAMIGRVLSWIPFTAPTMMMMRLTLGEIPLIDIIGSIAVCLISIPVLVWAGSKIFRTGLLMYGKRLKLKEIWRVLRST